MREILELRDFIASGNLMGVEFYTEFHAIKDSPRDEIAEEGRCSDQDELGYLRL